MVPGSALGRPADSDLPASQSLHALLGSDHAAAGRNFAGSTTGGAELRAGMKLLPASPLQAFLLGYVCGILWYAGTCYWIYGVMHQYGGVNMPAGIGILILFCLYLAIYHGIFGLLVSLLAGSSPFNLRALLLSPVVWVAVELARTRITGFPWGLLGTTQ